MIWNWILNCYYLSQISVVVECRWDTVGIRNRWIPQAHTEEARTDPWEWVLMDFKVEWYILINHMLARKWISNIQELLEVEGTIPGMVTVVVHNRATGVKDER